MQEEKQEENLPNEDSAKAASSLPNEDSAKAASSLPTEAQSVEEFKAQMMQLQKEKDEYLESLRRAKSDFLRYKQDEAKRAEEIMIFSNKTLIVTLLPILDSFDLALGLVAQHAEVRRGFEMIQTQLESALRNFGLEPIHPRVGEEKANPELHEVVDRKACENASCNKQDEGLIAEVRGAGYRLYGKLLRPAKVKVITH